MGQDGKIRKSSGRLTPEQFNREVAVDQAREERLLWWELAVSMVIGLFAAVCTWIES